MIQALGKQTSVELFGCNPKLLNNKVFLEKALITAAKRAGATVIQTVFHQFSPYGITGVVVVAESHFAIHTWPEYGYAAIDIFTCGQVNNKAAADYLRDSLEAEKCELKMVNRGVLNIPNLSHKPKV